MLGCESLIIHPYDEQYVPHISHLEFIHQRLLDGLDHLDVATDDEEKAHVENEDDEGCCHR